MSDPVLMQLGQRELPSGPDSFRVAPFVTISGDVDGWEVEAPIGSGTDSFRVIHIGVPVRCLPNGDLVGTGSMTVRNGELFIGPVGYI